MGLTLEERNKALEFLDKGAEFMFIPSTSLIDKVVIGHPSTSEINSALKILIMERKAIRLSQNMVKKYCKGILDVKNSWLLDQGDLKVVPNQFEIK